MSDIGEDFHFIRQENKMKKLANVECSLRMLTERGLKYEVSQSKSEMKRQKALRESESVEGHIQIGDLILSTSDTYNGHFWISRPDGEGMQVGEKTLTELIELLEAFYRKHL